MSHRSAFLALFIVAGLTASGCSFFYDEDGAPAPDEVWEAPPPPSYGTSPAMPYEVQNGFMQGDMGEIRGFAGEAYDQQVYGDASWAQVRIDVLGEYGWAMLAFALPTGVDPFTIPPGTVLETTVGTGCSGPSYGNYTMDGPTDQMQITVDEGAVPGSVAFDFRATFAAGRGTQVVDGSFDLVRSE
jgi:hypothetical protein